MMQRSKVGVALGSGGARGFAHIGVLKALAEHGVSVDVVTGSSMGSLIGAFYATGMTPGFMERLATSLRLRHWADFAVPKLGLITGERVRQLVAMLTRNRDIEQADLPLAIVATDLVRRKVVTFQRGSIASAVRASISIPGVFVPYVYDGGLFVDGGLIDPVPVDAARALGADVVIAVDVASQRYQRPETMFDVVMQSLDVMAASLREPRAIAEDTVYLTPDVSHVGLSQFHKASTAIQAGYESAMAQMEEIVNRVHRASGRATS